MRFCTYQTGKKPKAGVVIGKRVYDLGQCFFRTFKRPFAFRDLLEFLRAGGMDKVGEVDFAAFKKEPHCSTKAADVAVLAPIMRPPKIVCVGLNYRSHAEEQGAAIPEHPLLFAKAPNATIGPGDEVVIPYHLSEKIDYEVELAAVIGVDGYRIPREEALSHVFGYTILNDVTARDIQKGDRQWFRGKSCATFAPQGPSVVTADELDPSSLDLRLRLNGEEMQVGNTSDLIFDVPALIEFASAAFPLEVGDIISTGTPSGVGFARKPPVWLRAGDVMEAEIEGIGVLSNTVR